MNCRKLLPLVFLVCSYSCLASEIKFGVVTSQNGVLCASFGDKPPAIGSSISIIETQSPQYFFKGSLSTAHESCEALEKANVAGPYFTVTSVKKIASPFIGVAVVTKNVLAVVNNEVVLASPKSKEKMRFRGCTSSEGLHLSSWLGEPLKGKQTWHQYFYLGYDVEPSCENSDFKE